MARLRNRIRKADYFTDGELLRWPRDKRATYSGLWALAEDSGCLEDDQFEWKLSLWPSPMDTDITVELLTQWRDELVAAGKLIPYESDGKRYLFIRTFHQHEHPRNPQSADLPLPPWVSIESIEWVGKDGKTGKRVSYTVSTESVQTPYRPDTDSVLAPQPRPALSGPVQSDTLSKRAGAHPSGQDLDSGKPLESKDPVENSTTPEPPPSPPPEPKPRKAANPNATCDEFPCQVRCGRANVRGIITEIVGVEAAGEMYNLDTDLGRSVAKVAAAICEHAATQLAESPRPERDKLCAKLLRRYFERAAGAHRNEPIRNLPAYINGTLKAAAHLGDIVGDDLVTQLRTEARRKTPPTQEKQAVPAPKVKAVAS